MAVGLAEAGANIVIAARNETKTSESINRLKGMGTECEGIQVEVTEESSVQQMVSKTIDRFGSLDILINNAGIGIRKLPHEYTIKEWNKVVDINLTGAFICSKEVYPHMKENGGGKIINIGSMTSIFGLDWAVAYASSKGGIVQMTKTLAVSWAKDNIQANSILPGWIHTDLTQGLKDNFRDRYDHILTRIPHERWGEPNDLAGTAVFLSSKASDYVTGVSIPVDGGYTSF